MLSLSTVSFCRSWSEWEGEREKVGELPIPELTGSVGTTRSPEAIGSEEVSVPELLQMENEQSLIPSRVQSYLRGKNFESSSGSMLS